jgi:hypothetical protein
VSPDVGSRGFEVTVLKEKVFAFGAPVNEACRVCMRRDRGGLAQGNSVITKVEGGEMGPREWKDLDGGVVVSTLLADESQMPIDSGGGGGSLVMTTHAHACHIIAVTWTRISMILKT